MHMFSAQWLLLKTSDILVIVLNIFTVLIVILLPSSTEALRLLG